MSTISSIEWTERTWNPVVGCLKVSQGCKNCYAEVMARRLKAMRVSEYQQPFTIVRELPHRLGEPLVVKKPSVWFVNSMSDLFQDGVSDVFITRVFDTIRQGHWHQFQILTKRPERMAHYFSRHPAPPANAWLGVSVENIRQGVPRIAILRQVPATVRFLSIEPLLEALGELDLLGIHWVIVGGESGAGARPMERSWVEAIQRQCEQQEVPFFFKQWGAYAPTGERRSKSINGRVLAGRTWDEMPVLA